MKENTKESKTHKAVYDNELIARSHRFWSILKRRQLNSV
jgi:hypothetical protein